MKYLIAVFMMLVSLSANAAMTEAQQQTLAAAIRADTDPTVVAALSVRNDTELTNLYRQPSAFWVWRTRVTQDEIMQGNFDWTRVDNLGNGPARVWEWMFGNADRSINPSKANVRSGIEAVWKGTAADLAVRASVYTYCKRNASKAEALFVTGTGTNADPGLLGWEGPISTNDISDALNKY